ncbi:MAG: hypothetical protein J0I99_03375 [Devosia sp.]|uniref:hypothetical protein n=1 Tax=Devosia sp. TaxID=1871048 RepID=UPI001ACA4A16|nr:hypothetical protein [Devosia sp.]MBN9314755.1 hypothetical protein [Devosia sp.]
MPVPSVSEHPRHRAIRERRVRGRIESALSAVAGWLVTSEENGRPGSHPLFREELDQLVWLLDTAEAAVSRTMGAKWRARFAPRDTVTRGEVRLALVLAFEALEEALTGFEGRDKAERAARPAKRRRRYRGGMEWQGPHHPLPLIPEPEPEPEPEPVSPRPQPALPPQPPTRPANRPGPRRFYGLAGEPIDIAELRTRSKLGF